MGFGPVAPETNEPYFHAEWERRALGVTLCAGAMGHWTIDESRHARESLHPATYYAASYYEIWIRALEMLLQRHGFVTGEELSQGRAIDGGTPARRVLRADAVAETLARGGPCDRDVDGEPRFRPGQRVRARNMHPSAHTRLPRYVRGRVGRVESVHGGYVFPDTNAHGEGEAPQWVYTVVFDGAELWGDGADTSSTVSIDAWESYLEPA
jgi:nitrile hydratase beta subunit